MESVMWWSSWPATAMCALPSSSVPMRKQLPESWEGAASVLDQAADGDRSDVAGCGKVLRQREADVHQR